MNGLSRLNYTVLAAILLVAFTFWYAFLPYSKMPLTKIKISEPEPYCTSKIKNGRWTSTFFLVSDEGVYYTISHLDNGFCEKIKSITYENQVASIEFSSNQKGERKVISKLSVKCNVLYEYKNSLDNLCDYLPLRNC
ncbi:hypothetical protein [Enterovibrio nigricans]|uniref:Uncharacterized protein n=1 Tax=Enterovibrio nigricans DSM 22720 TaxID=1121868 RepID=A0A1T4U4Q1_9GAMM|nr:hypothetical protein [Enterovibrio nigricans]SKA47715.1 hypothetical protein SAMN02745132_00746 [Enterovibrio nigricans DSM 22720]